jgi:hypothetical protein
MFVDVAPGDRVRDTLVAESVKQPIEYLGRVLSRNRRCDAGFLNIGTNLVQK